MWGRLFGGEKTGPEPEAEKPAAPGESAAPLPDDTLPPPEAAPEAESPQPKQGWLERLRSGLSKTSNKLTDGITSVFTKKKLDALALEELEDLLIQADLGIETASRISDALSAGRYNKDISPEE